MLAMFITVLLMLNFMMSPMVAVENDNVNMMNFEFRTSCGDLFGFKRYYRIADIYAYMDYLVNSYPEFVSSEIIGYSVEGREIRLFKISSCKPDSISIWIDGGTHAREWISVSTVMYIIIYLIENRDKLGKEIRETDFYFVTIVNPDGYEYSHTGSRLWRTNRRVNEGSECIGVDLNRNYPNHWGEGGTTSDPCDITYCGPFAASEPEVVTVMDVLKERSYMAMVSFHSFSQFILLPYEYTYTHVDNYDEQLRVANIMAEAIVERTNQKYTVGTAAEVAYIASGVSIDWAQDNTDIPYCYIVELRDSGTNGFTLSSSEIIPTGEDGLATVLTLVKQFYIS